MALINSKYTVENKKLVLTDIEIIHCCGSEGVAFRGL